MAISGAQLQFLITMRNQATAVINQATQGMRGMGTAAQGAGNQVNSLSRSMTELNQSLEAAKKGFGEVRDVVQSTLESFRAYDLQMNIVQRVTQQSGEQMGSFSQEFDAMANRLKTVDVSRLGDITIQAVQLGITGTDNILKFTETMGKLETSIKDLGDQAPKLIVRVLNALGQGTNSDQFAKNVEKFGNTFTALANESSAAETVILTSAATIAQATARFKPSTESVLGLATAFSNLSIQPQLGATATQRALQAIYDAAITNSDAMVRLSEATHMTSDEWKNLIEHDPVQALIKFSGVLNAVSESGRSSTQFLRGFGLQAAETERILGTVGKQQEEFLKTQVLARSASETTILQDQYNTALKAYDTAVKSASNSWTLFKKNIGEGLSPISTSILNAMTTALNYFSDTLKSLTPAGQTIAAVIATVAASIGGVGVAFLAVGRILTAFGATAVGGAVLQLTKFAGVLLRFVSGWTIIRTTIMAVFSVITAVIGAVGGFVALMGVLVVGLIALAVYVLTHWEAVRAFFSQSWSDIFKSMADAGMDALGKFFGWLKDSWTSVKNFFFKGNTKAEVQPPSAALPTTGSGVTGPVQTDTSVYSKIIESQIKVLDALDQETKTRGKLREQELVLQALRKVGADDQLRREREISDYTISRYEGKIALERLQMNEVLTRVKALREETEQAAAVTAEEKKRLEIVQAVRAVQEKRSGINPLSDAERLRVVNEVLKKQATERDAVLRQQNIDMQDQINLIKITGEYYEADRQALTTINQLRDRGVQLTKEQQNAVQQYTRALKDVEDSQSSGLEGFARQVGSIRKQVLDLQKSVANNISDGIQSVLNGSKTAFKDFMTSLQKSFSKFAADNIVKELIAPIGNNIGGIFKGLSSKEAIDKATGAAAQIGAITTPLVSITAGSVSLVGGMGNLMTDGGMPKFGLVPGQQGFVGPVQTPALPSNMTVDVDSVNGVATAAGKVNSEFQGMAVNANGLSGPLGAVNSGLGGLGSALTSLASMLAKSFGGIGITSAEGSTLAATAVMELHSGGVVGRHGRSRIVPLSAMAGARRYHTGLKNDEFSAILQRGERVLTQSDNAKLAGLMTGMTKNAGGGVQMTYAPTITISNGQASVQGGTQASDARAKAVGEQLDNKLRSIVIEVLQRESRPNGMLRKGR